MNEVIKRNWGSDVIDIKGKNLPSLKANWLLGILKNKSGKLLEIGCNGGRVLKTISKYNPNIVLFGCDIDERAIKRVISNTNIRAFVADGQNLPVCESEFDFVVTMDYLEHVPDVKKALKEIFRVLKPGGYFIGFLPCEGQKFSCYSIYRKIFRKDIKSLTCGHFPLKRKELKKIFSKLNGQLVEESFSYHLLGQTMDFVFFWFVANSRKIGDWWWNQNQYYFSSKTSSPVGNKIFSNLVGFGNFLAYYESKTLRRISLSSVGWHVVIKKNRN